MTRILVLALLLPCAAFAAPDFQIEKIKSLTLAAQHVGEDSRDQALAALYNRLFALQDLKRDAEIGIEIAELRIDDAVLEYKRFNRWMDKEKLKEVSQDPQHRDYPNITEKTKLALVGAVRSALREQKISSLKIARYDQDITATERMIEKHLASRGGNS
ncbi:MAG: hypothetical protein COB53_12615 [Elusimicrobia bacterium]|nr:MAG: hypothetical protein COB53_12615 [Elusimicrobiota bacterium]